ncbi:hypothetical protein CCMSSC00406_0008047 [Pleurotus cornucopiae]|uniref:Uncharacterized protein n=1 Tax=Pleurotus cornucopiae TaxID=5321 RepID=A0ACB7IV41_PLECO|nr:hypothetical protein CCMSSC00406_0008047 [Pleurotus cornucopiae]
MEVTSALQDPLILFLLAILGIMYFWKLLNAPSRSRLPLPPGPKKYPIIGSLLEMPSSEEWVKFAEWSKEYNSDIIHLQVAGTSIVIVNSAETAHELFDKRSTIYSSRPRLVMINELMGWEWAVAHMPEGDDWRQHRRLFQQNLNPSSIPNFQPQVIKFSRRLLLSLLDNPDGFMDHVRHFVGAVLMDLSHGIQTRGQDDPYINVVEQALQGLIQAIVPGRFLVETFPIMKYIPEWMPGAKFQRLAKEWRELATRVVMDPFKKVKQDIADGIPNDSFVTRCLQNTDEKQDIGAQERVIRQVGAGIFIGGTDTTVSTLDTFLLAMVMHPEVQARAQKEIDAVLGGNRLPLYEDEERLPYIAAILREVLRWQPSTPLAIPHFTTADDEYRGYAIPKGSIAMGNAWAMLHDEQKYPDPFAFKPERWLTEDGKLNPDLREPSAIFGFGRRACVGRHLAFPIIWMAATSILSVLNMKKALDADGKPIEPSTEYVSAIVRHAPPFKCVIEPRSEKAEKLIRELVA